MSKIALGVALVFSGFFVALAVRDPLAAAALTPAQRAAGFRSVEIEVNGENCRFCRINVEHILKAVAGVKVAKADMAHHRARVVYDPSVVQPATLLGAIRTVGD
jgi:P-type Cu2+ transporter